MARRHDISDTLPDFVRPGLRVLAVGINPSPHAVRAGYPFAFPRNRFWPALNASRLLDAPLVPSVAAMKVLRDRYGIGFTDVVKRPTPGVRDLARRDFAAAVPLLGEKITRLAPRVLWFHGMVAARAVCRELAPADVVAGWGEQPYLVAGTRSWVSPNPSPANARFSLAELVASYDGLADVLARLDGACA
ncbi:MAG: mismatch-specific DNA-glycosylase [Gammaproteobacteria bacterium]